MFASINWLINLHKTAPDKLLQHQKLLSVIRGRSYHKGWEIEAGPSSAKNHIAGNFKEKISDEENRERERIVGRREVQVSLHASYFGISNATSILDINLVSWINAHLFLSRSYQWVPVSTLISRTGAVQYIQLRIYYDVAISLRCFTSANGNTYHDKQRWNESKVNFPKYPADL